MLPPAPNLALDRSPHLWNQLTFSVFWEEAWQILILGVGKDSDLGLVVFNGEDSSAWEEEGW